MSNFHMPHHNEPVNYSKAKWLPLKNVDRGSFYHLQALIDPAGCTVSAKVLKQLGTIHVWLHHKNLNAYFSKSFTKRLLEGVSIYKAFVNLSSPANKAVQLWVKHELEIEGV